MGSGTEAIEDDLELEAVRRQARRIRKRALGIAVGTTLGLLLLP